MDVLALCRLCQAVLGLLCILVKLVQPAVTTGMLYPRDSESRETKYLDGIWQFRADMSPTRNKGFLEKWWLQPLSKTGFVIDMPVPSSYNDITEQPELRDFVGWVWYEKEFFVSPSWANDKRVVLRFDSAHYHTIVWLNGEQVLEHIGGHLPFESDVSSNLNFYKVSRLTVAVNNTLSPTTLPPGVITYQTDTSKYPPGYFTQDFHFDFFNYAGIHRHVRLYTTPMTYLDDITILTDISGNNAEVSYSITKSGPVTENTDINISVVDGSGKVIKSSSTLNGSITIQDPKLWWPFGMNNSIGYQYLLLVNISGDVYRQPFGIRTVQVTDKQILINNKPFYCHGVAKHEDSDIRGKGLDYSLITKDFNMLRWLGVNCIRTSHYPYAEEILFLADQQGVAVIDESPGVGIVEAKYMSDKSLQHHLEVMSEMIRRDKNKPSAIMWSVANEPKSDIKVAEKYFKAVIEHTRAIDPAKRPVTFVSNKEFDSDRVVQFVDVICMNRYYAWYHDPGHLEVIQLQLGREFKGFRAVQNKPIIVTEYGADTIPGLHREPSYMFTEDFQVDFLQQYHKQFDKARKEFLVGEMVWNFADFMTTQNVKRVVGNKKGLLTRQRQPKRAAFVIRERYHALASGQDTTVLYRSKNLVYSPHSYFKYSEQSQYYNNDNYALQYEVDTI